MGDSQGPEESAHLLPLAHVDANDGVADLTLLKSFQFTVQKSVLWLHASQKATEVKKGSATACLQ